MHPNHRSELAAMLPGELPYPYFPAREAAWLLMHRMAGPQQIADLRRYVTALDRLQAGETSAAVDLLRDIAARQPRFTMRILRRNSLSKLPATSSTDCARDS